MRTALKSIAEKQAHTTQHTQSEITHFQYYSSNNPTAVVQFKAIDMALHIESDASYLSEPWVCSRTVEHYYLSYQTANPKKSPHLPPPKNGPISTEYIILRHMVASANKAEVRGLFHNGKIYVPLRITLKELGFPQP